LSRVLLILPPNLGFGRLAGLRTSRWRGSLSAEGVKSSVQLPPKDAPLAPVGPCLSTFLSSSLVQGPPGLRSLCICVCREYEHAMEVLRNAGLEKRASAVALDARCMQHTSRLRSLNGEEYGRLWVWGNKPSQKGDYEAASPCVMFDLPQHVLEPILVEEAGKELCGIFLVWRRKRVSKQYQP
jgi:hypothetical protein